MGVAVPEDTAGLDLRQASVLRQSVVSIKNPVVKAEAIRRVRAEVQRPGKERVGTRGIPDVVRQVRQEADPTPKPVVPLNVAMGVERLVENFFSQGIHVGHQTMSLEQVIATIAANRDTKELQGLTSPMADQIAMLLTRMSDQALRLAGLLREEKVMIGAGR